MTTLEEEKSDLEKQVALAVLESSELRQQLESEQETTSLTESDADRTAQLIQLQVRRAGGQVRGGSGGGQVGHRWDTGGGQVWHRCRTSNDKLNGPIPTSAHFSLQTRVSISQFPPPVNQRPFLTADASLFPNSRLR